MTQESMKSRNARKPLWIAIIAIVAWLGISGVAGPTFGKLSSVQENDNSAFLPANAESTQANKITVKFSAGALNQLPTLLLFVGDVNPTKLAAVNQYVQTLPNKEITGTGKTLKEFILPGAPISVFPSQDGKAILGNIALIDKVATSTINNKPALPQVIKFVREDMAKNMSSSNFETHVTGFGGILADLFGAFGSIDSTLLLTTLGVVSIILIIVYRSPFLWILPLFTAVTALSLAGTIIYYLAKANLIDLSGQSQGILSVLVLGAATDYALLLISRYREELHHHASRFESMGIALRGVIEPIIASGSTVIAGLLVLLLSELSSNRGLGPVGAIGIASAMVTVLTFLPALLVIFGRWIFWPKIPRFDDENAQLKGFWAKVGLTVDKYPRRTAMITAILLVVLAAFSFQLKSNGISTTESFTGTADSVVGQEKLLQHFPGGEGSPVEIIVKESDVQKVTAKLLATPGVSAVMPTLTGPVIPGQALPSVKVVDGQVLLNATLKVPADSVEGRQLTPVIRDAVHAIDSGILVGGGGAINYDVDVASRHDNRLIIPIVLLIIAVILGLLLRSILAAIVLLITVVLSFMATLGVCYLVFTHIFNFPGTDTSFPLFAFVFLVALGIDYNIFLMTRVREETLKMGTRRGVIRGLTVTGGVITSAGVVLAATFAVLGVLPLVFLAELGFAVAFGVLLDTIVVRSLLVPAIVHLLGPKTWWPSKLQHERKDLEALPGK